MKTSCSSVTVTTVATNNRTTNTLTIKCPFSEYQETVRRKVHISTYYCMPVKNKMLQSQRTNTMQTNQNTSNSGFYRISEEQMAVLENAFLKNKILHNTDIELLAAELGLDERDVQTWYHERLAAWRRGQGLSDSFGQL